MNTDNMVKDYKCKICGKNLILVYIFSDPVHQDHKITYKVSISNKQMEVYLHYKKCHPLELDVMRVRGEL